MIEYIAKAEHYNKVLAKVASVNKSLWLELPILKTFAPILSNNN